MKSERSEVNRNTIYIYIYIYIYTLYIIIITIIYYCKLLECNVWLNDRSHVNVARQSKSHMIVIKPSHDLACMSHMTSHDMV